jgi:hypothetical protein
MGLSQPKITKSGDFVARVNLRIIGSDHLIFKFFALTKKKCRQKKVPIQMLSSLDFLGGEPCWFAWSGCPRRPGLTVLV